MKVTNFPKAMRGLRCPTCNKHTYAIAVYSVKTSLGAKEEKRLLPCQHLLSMEQEEKIVADIIKTDLKNG